MEIEWVEQVPERRRTGKWTRICDELRERPGHWAKVETASSTAYATMLKQGKLGDARPGEFEATTRRREDGDYDIYARCVLPHETAYQMRPLAEACLVYSD